MCYREEQWFRYVDCRGLPFAEEAGSMRVYLEVWRQEGKSTTLEALEKRMEDVLYLLQLLDDLIETPLDASPQLFDNWVTVRRLFR
jgi:hypothetical protein